MSYLLTVRNKYNYGHCQFKCNSIADVEKILKDHIFDGEITLLETREIPLPCEHDNYWPSQHPLTDFGNKMLWKDACVSKSYLEKGEK